MDRPKVSVVISVYNAAPYLRETVLSVTSQSLKELEIILVNDGSTDDSLSVLRSIENEDPRICIINQEHKGRPVSRNVGMEHATGEFIYFMNSMDNLNSDSLEYAYKFCKKKQLNFAFFDGDVIEEERGINFIHNNYHRTGPYNEIVVYKGLMMFDDMLDNRTYRPVPWLLFISRSFLQETGIRFYPGIVHDDELFTALLFIQSDRIGCIKRSLIKHRVLKDFVSANVQSLYNVHCYLTVLDELFAYAGRFPYLYPHIRKYTSITLNRVFYFAYTLSFRDKIRVLRMCIKSRYLRYLRGATLFRFLLKK